MHIGNKVEMLNPDIIIDDPDFDAGDWSFTLLNENGIEAAVFGIAFWETAPGQLTLGIQVGTYEIIFADENYIIGSMSINIYDLGGGFLGTRDEEFVAEVVELALECEY